MSSARVSDRTLLVLHSISQGRGYDQVLQDARCESYLDIFRAAEEAYQVLSGQKKGRYDDIRKRHPRAYEPWSGHEEEALINALENGSRVSDIGRQLGRQPSAISSRIRKLKEAGELS